MAAARARDWYDEEAKKRQRASLKQGNEAPVVEHVPPRAEKGKSRDLAGKTFGVSGRSVDEATRIIERGTPELVKAASLGGICSPIAPNLASLKQGKESPVPEHVPERSVKGEARDLAGKTFGVSGRHCFDAVTHSGRNIPEPGLTRHSQLAKLVASFGRSEGLRTQGT